MGANAATAAQISAGMIWDFSIFIFLFIVFRVIDGIGDVGEKSDDGSASDSSDDEDDGESTKNNASRANEKNSKKNKNGAVAKVSILINEALERAASMDEARFERRAFRRSASAAALGSGSCLLVIFQDAPILASPSGNGKRKVTHNKRAHHAWKVLLCAFMRILHASD